jgi:hypothetical protein
MQDDDLTVVELRAALLLLKLIVSNAQRISKLA